MSDAISTGAVNPAQQHKLHRAAEGFPDRLNAEMSRLGLGPVALARALPTSQQQVSRWRHGISVPGAVWLMRLADQLEVDARWLLLGDLPRPAVGQRP